VPSKFLRTDATPTITSKWSLVIDDNGMPNETVSRLLGNMQDILSTVVFGPDESGRSATRLSGEATPAGIPITGPHNKQERRNVLQEAVRAGKVPHLVDVLSGRGDPRTKWGYVGGTEDYGTFVCDLGNEATLRLSKPYVDKRIVASIIRSLAGLTSTISGRTTIKKRETNDRISTLFAREIHARVSGEGWAMTPEEISVALLVVDVPMLLWDIPVAQRALQAALPAGRQRIAGLSQAACDALILSRNEACRKALLTMPLIPFVDESPAGKAFTRAVNSECGANPRDQRNTLYVNGALQLPMSLIELWNSGSLTVVEGVRLCDAVSGYTGDSRYKDFLGICGNVLRAISAVDPEIRKRPEPEYHDFSDIQALFDPVAKIQKEQNLPFRVEMAIMMAALTGAFRHPGLRANEIARCREFIDALHMGSLGGAIERAPLALAFLMVQLHSHGYCMPPPLPEEDAFIFPKSRQQQARERYQRGLQAPEHNIP